MKRIIALSILAFVAFLPSPIYAQAPSSDTVTITAMGYIAESPTGLVVTYIDDFELLLNWNMGADSVKTSIRAMYGRPVMDKTDGFELYLGTNNSTTHFVQNVGYEPIYYKGFSQRADGLWEEYGSANTEANFMSISFMFIGIVLLLIAMMTLSFIYKFTWLFIITGFLWFGIGIYALIAYWGGGTSSNALYLVVGWSGLGMMFVMWTVPFYLKPKEEKRAGRTEMEQMADDYSEYSKQLSSYHDLRKIGRRKR